MKLFTKIKSWFTKPKTTSSRGSIIFVVATNRRVATQTAAEAGLPDGQWVYVNSTMILRGRDNIPVLYGYGYWKHPEWNDIRDQLSLIGCWDYGHFCFADKEHYGT